MKQVSEAVESTIEQVVSQMGEDVDVVKISITLNFELQRKDKEEAPE